MNLAPKANCRHCGIHPESLDHLFGDCSAIDYIGSKGFCGLKSIRVWASKYDYAICTDWTHIPCSFINTNDFSLVRIAEVVPVWNGFQSGSPFIWNTLQCVFCLILVPRTITDVQLMCAFSNPRSWVVVINSIDSKISNLIKTLDLLGLVSLFPERKIALLAVAASWKTRNPNLIQFNLNELPEGFN